MAMIVTTSVVLSVLTWKFQASERYSSIVRKDVAPIPNQIAWFNWKFKITSRDTIHSVLAGR